MGLIDVVIPGVVGLILVLIPGVFARPTGDSALDQLRIRKFRIIGLVLLGVAALYLCIKLASR